MNFTNLCLKLMFTNSERNLILDLVPAQLFCWVCIVTVEWRQRVWKSYTGCLWLGRHKWLGLAWLGSPWLGRPTSAPVRPLGSCGGSDKNGFPDQGQIDSWVPEEDWWIWDWDGRWLPLTGGPLWDLQGWQNMLDLMKQIVWHFNPKLGTSIALLLALISLKGFA